MGKRNKRLNEKRKRPNHFSNIHPVNNQMMKLDNQLIANDVHDQTDQFEFNEYYFDDNYDCEYEEMYEEADEADIKSRTMRARRYKNIKFRN